MDAAAKKSTKKTTTEQFGVLVVEMEKNPELARGTPVFGASRIKVDEKWSSISAKINSYGPPQRSALEWRKTWADLKSRTKKKISENYKSLRETGGGPYRFNPLTDMEQTIDRILSISTAAQPRGVVFGVETENAVTTSPRETQPIGVVTPTRATFSTMDTPSTPTRASSSRPIQPRPIDEIDASNASGPAVPKPFKRKRNYLEEQAKLIRLELKNQETTIEEMRKQNSIAQAQAESLKMLAEASMKQAEAATAIAQATTAHAEAAKEIAAAMQEVLGLLKNK